MSSQQFDPDKITSEDIFRAKEERRRQLAKLPLEEKIEIVKRLQTVPAKMAENERLIFDSFLRVCPNFADEPIEEWDVVNEWYARCGTEPPAKPFDKRPDVIAVTASGKTIGVDLKSWVNRDQITAARRQERIQENILKAIGEQPPNETKHIGYVWLFAKQVRFDARDAADFQRELFSLIERVDRDWPQKPDWDQESDIKRDDKCDFAAFPALQKYLVSVALYARPEFEENWIHFPSRGGAYSPNDMLATLSSALASHKNDDRYKHLKDQVGLDEVYLLVHYDFKAFAYNTPLDAPNFGFKEAAEFASNVLDRDGGNFDRVFLFHFLWGNEEAYKIFPSFGPCP
jgi:hypothetical protein